MYETATYAELKKLPAAEKPVAWKELKSLYKTQKEVADKLGVSPAIVYSMISRYASSDKKVKLEVVKEQKKTRAVARTEKATQRIAASQTNPIEPEMNEVESESFSIAVKKAVSGEDAQFLLNGIGSTLLKNQNYLIEVKITEK